MPNFSDTYRDQLPRLRGGIASRIVSSIGLVAIVTALWPYFRSGYSTPMLVVISVLFVTFISSLIFGMRLRRDRYGQSIFFLHYANHLVKDYVASVKSQQSDISEPLHNLISSITNCVSECFSLITGTRCRVQIVEIQEDMVVNGVSADSITQALREWRTPGALKDYTPYYNLLYGAEGALRYYLTGNTKNEWRLHKFNTPEFNIYGHPQLRIMFGGLTTVYRWRLPYRSVLVLPIRYLPAAWNWPPIENESRTTEEMPFIWGFVRIDCPKKNAFDSVFCPELASAFADALCVLFMEAATRTEIKSPMLLRKFRIVDGA